jgi:hypothetical protein
MKSLPPAADLGHLKKQAKTLLRLYRSGDPAAIERFGASLPAAAHRRPNEIAALQLRLHAAQSCVAREYATADDMVGSVADPPPSPRFEQIHHQPV